MKKIKCPYFVIFIRILSACFLVPFRICTNTKAEEGERTFLTSCKSRKITSFLINVLLLASNFIWTLFSFSIYLGKKYNIAAVFYVVAIVSAVCGMISLQYIFWVKPEGILRFLELTSVMSSSQAAKRAKRQRFLMALICVGFLIVVSFQAYFTHTSGAYSEQFHQFFRKPISSFCELIGSSNCTPPSSHDQDLQYLLIHTLFIIMYSTMLYSFCFVTLFMMVLALSFKNFTENFVVKDIQNTPGNACKIIEQYLFLKEVTVTARSKFGSFILFYYIAALSFIAEMPPMLLNHDFPRALLLSMHVIWEWTTLTLAVKSQSKLDQCLRSCIMQYQLERDIEYSTKERVKLLSILHDLDKEPVGLSCSFFTLTRNFLTTTLGIAVSYSIIAFQMTEQK